MQDICIQKNVQHGVENDSKIKTVIDNWYKTTTLETDSKTKKLVVDSIFCNDRTAVSSSNGTPGEIDGNMSTNSTYYYGSYVRVITNKSPQLTCPSDSDKFTTNTNSGNGALTYPVGLITADEVAMAGGVYDSNNFSYYLHTGENYWLWSPGDFVSKVAKVFYIFNYGSISTTSSNSTYGIRPVISLSPNVILSGNGTFDDVYTVS